MDTLTHSLIGAVSSRAITGSRSQSYMLVTALAAAFPDIDYLLFWLNPYQMITEWHRGPTHSLLLLPLWALLLSMLFYWPMRRRVTFRNLLLLCSLGLLSHIVSDWMTIFGIQLFTPVSSQRYALGLAFDIDPWVSLIVVLVWLSGFQHRVTAIISLFLIGGYLGFLYYGQQTALQAVQARIKQGGPPPLNVQVLPEPMIPWHWKLIIDRRGHYEIAHLSLQPKASSLLFPFTGSASSNIRETASSPEGIGPSNVKAALAQHRDQSMLVWRTLHKFGSNSKQSKQLERLWQHPDLVKFRQFSTLPALYRVDQTENTSCVWFTDLRYVFPLIFPPFRYGMCQYTADQQWRLYRLKRGSYKQRERIELY